ncbi:ankyrin repeat domain-containing protein [Candidatus Jidaibacter acanthamoebae]|nr:ankyrin repeat domain-containing protein [Candidatus Jidaibacter acanthamoeba]
MLNSDERLISVDYKSKFDDKLIITLEIGIVTLFRRGLHAEIGIEYLNEGKAVYKMVHLTGRGSSSGDSNISLGNGSGPSQFIPGVSSEGVVQILDLSNKPVKKEGESISWEVSKKKALALLHYAERNPLQKFNIYGHSNFVNRIQQLAGYEEFYSCVSWACAVLNIAGINIKYDAVNLFIYTPSLISKSTIEAVSPVDITTLCKFAKTGNTEAIITNFPPEGSNVNELTSYATSGPVETFLGTYSPLSIAVSYGQYEVVKLLIEKYHALPNQLIGRREDHTALDCAYKNFWFSGVKESAKEAVQNYLKSIGGKFYTDLSHQEKVVASRNEESSVSKTVGM